MPPAPLPQVRTHHDELAKRVLKLWLKRLGDVHINQTVPGETRSGDVYFVERGKHRGLGALGALGVLAHGRISGRSIERG